MYITVCPTGPLDMGGIAGIIPIISLVLMLGGRFTQGSHGVGHPVLQRSGQVGLVDGVKDYMKGDGGTERQVSDTRTDRQMSEIYGIDRTGRD